jgi:hypothetical protein
MVVMLMPVSLWVLIITACFCLSSRKTKGAIKKAIHK